MRMLLALVVALAGCDSDPPPADATLADAPLADAPPPDALACPPLPDDCMAACPGTPEETQACASAPYPQPDECTEICYWTTCCMCPHDGEPTWAVWYVDCQPPPPGP